MLPWLVGSIACSCPTAKSSSGMSYRISTISIRTLLLRKLLFISRSSAFSSRLSRSPPGGGSPNERQPDKGESTRVVVVPASNPARPQLNPSGFV